MPSFRPQSVVAGRNLVFSDSCVVRHLAFPSPQLVLAHLSRKHHPSSVWRRGTCEVLPFASTVTSLPLAACQRGWTHTLPQPGAGSRAESRGFSAEPVLRVREYPEEPGSCASSPGTPEVLQRHCRQLAARRAASHSGDGHRATASVPCATNGLGARGALPWSCSQSL